MSRIINNILFLKPDISHRDITQNCYIDDIKVIEDIKDNDDKNILLLFDNFYLVVDYTTQYNNPITDLFIIRNEERLFFDKNILFSIISINNDFSIVYTRSNSKLPIKRIEKVSKSESDLYQIKYSSHENNLNSNKRYKIEIDLAYPLISNEEDNDHIAAVRLFI